MIRADQIPKIKKYGLSCSIQPQFVESDAPWVGFKIILTRFWVGFSRPRLFWIGILIGCNQSI